MSTKVDDRMTFAERAAARRSIEATAAVRKQRLKDRRKDPRLKGYASWSAYFTARRPHP